MKTYVENDHTLTIDGVAIPKEGGNRLYIEALNEVLCGEAEIVRPTPTLDEAKTSKKAEATSRRREVETGGITVDGVAVATGEADQNRIAASKIYLADHPEAVIDWKGTGGWTVVDMTAIDAIAAAVGAHVEACFSAERTHHEAIDALTSPEAVMNHDVTTGWPG